MEQTQENIDSLIQLTLDALETNLDDLSKKTEQRFDRLDKRLEPFVNAVHERFDGLEKLIRDTHSENGQNRGADD